MSAEIVATILLSILILRNSYGKIIKYFLDKQKLSNISSIFVEYQIFLVSVLLRNRFTILANLHINQELLKAKELSLFST